MEILLESEIQRQSFMIKEFLDQEEIMDQLAVMKWLPLEIQGQSQAPLFEVVIQQVEPLEARVEQLWIQVEGLQEAQTMFNKDQQIIYLRVGVVVSVAWAVLVEEKLVISQVKLEEHHTITNRLTKESNPKKDQLPNQVNFLSKKWLKISPLTRVALQDCMVLQLNR